MAAPKIATCGTCYWQVLESDHIVVGPVKVSVSREPLPVEDLARQHHEELGHVVVYVDGETGTVTSFPPESDLTHRTQP